MSLFHQLTWLWVLPLPVACVAWTVTHEEVFREWTDFCKGKCSTGPLLKRKFFYLFTCEYCFSHYVTVAFLLITNYQLLLTGWRGYLIAGFAVVWIANVYMSVYAWLRTSLKKERTEIKVVEQELNNNSSQ
jgi:hypothetical protein